MDDHVVVRESLALLINAQSDMTVANSASSGSAGLEAIELSTPDIVVCDLTLADGTAYSLFENLRLKKPLLPVLVFSMHTAHDIIEKCLTLGARGYISKSSTSSELLSAIREVAAGGTYLQPRLAFEILQGKRSNEGFKLTKLTDREKEMLQAIVDGASNQTISERLSLSLSSVKSHLRSLFNKLEAKDRAQAIVQATKRGYLSSSQLEIS